MGQITATRNLVATKVVRLAGQLGSQIYYKWYKSATIVSILTLVISWRLMRLFSLWFYS